MAVGPAYLEDEEKMNIIANLTAKQKAVIRRDFLILKKIKALDPGAKIIMCSAMGQQAMVIEAIQAGAKDFIVKPFQAERVLEAVKKVVG